MMSDHWKSLTRLLGAPSAAEPPEPKRKTEEAKPAERSSPAESSRSKDAEEKRGSATAEGTRAGSSGAKSPEAGPSESGPHKDPLKAMLETPQPTTLPGFGTASDSGEGSSSGWDALVKDLDVGAAGSETAEEVPTKREAKPDAPKAHQPRDIERPSERKPARKSGGFGAGLGLDLEPEPESKPGPEPESREQATRPSAAAKAEAPERPSRRQPADSDEGEEAGFGGPRRRRSGRGAPRGREREETSEVVQERIGDQSASGKTRREEPADTADDDGFGIGLVESDKDRRVGRAQDEGKERPESRGRDEDEDRASSRTRRPRRGRRRGVRQRADEMDETVVRGGAAADRDEGAAVDQDEDEFGGGELFGRLEDEPTVRRGEADTEEDEDGGPRRRRRRRRRRGGGEGRPDSGSPADSRGDAASDEDRPSGGPAIEATFDDDYEDAEEVTEMRRGRGRRRGRRGASASAESETVPADEARSSSERRGGRRQRPSEVEEVETSAKPRPKYRDVVTWADTVDVLISSNMEKRKREPQRGRGSRSGRSGRNGSRKRD